MADYSQLSSVRFHFTWTLVLLGGVFLIVLHQNEAINFIFHHDVSTLATPSKPLMFPPEAACHHNVTRSTLPWCSDRIFRDHIRAYRAFPECGEWRDNLQKYDMDFCNWKDLNLRLCIGSQGLQKIVVLGDSTGARLFSAIIRLIERKQGKCALRDFEYPESSTTPNATYFARRLGLTDVEAFYMTKRGCATCRAQHYSCTIGHQRLTVEFIESYLFKERSLVIPPNVSPVFNITSVRNMQEFIFSVYFPKLGHPDLLLFLMPMHHEKLRRPDVTARDFNFFMNLIRLMGKDSKIRRTKVLLIPSAGEFTGKRSPMVWSPSKGISPMDYLYVRNSMLFPLVEPFILDSDLNINGFINLVNMSMTRKEWSEDGIHFIKVWYDHVAKNVMSLFCA